VTVPKQGVIDATAGADGRPIPAVYAATPATPTLRNRLWRQLEPAIWQHASISPASRVIIVAVVASIAVFVLETEPAITGNWRMVLQIADLGLAVGFAVEYGLRLWAAGEEHAYQGLSGRLRWALTPMALVDLAAFLPSLLSLGFSDTFLLRILRLMRLMRLAKLGRYSTSLLLIELAVRRCRREMLVAVMLASGVLLISATMLWIAEAGAQPDTFGSIPRAMWWSVVTLTTVGYGDVYPITVVGRILGGSVAVMGIGMIALPAGILSASIVEVSRTLARRKRMLRRIRQHRHELRHRPREASPPDAVSDRPV
jgi:voltage-gated potassium channel